MSKLSYIDENMSHFENVLAHNVSTMFINTVEDAGGFDNADARIAGGAYLQENWKSEPHILQPFVSAIMKERGYDEA